MPGAIEPLRDLLRQWTPDERSQRALRPLRLIVLFLLHVALGFVEAVCDFAAPVLLILGVLWSVAPRLLEAIRFDGPGADLLAFVMAHFPTSLSIGGLLITAHGLVADGIVLFAIVAICRSASVVAAQAMADDE